jgi:hypothetical protein
MVTGAAPAARSGRWLPRQGSGTMKKSVTLMSLPLTLVIVLFASFQSRSMSPRMYSFLEKTAVLIGNTAMYENMPASAFDWSY